MLRLSDSKIVGELTRIFPTFLFVLLCFHGLKASECYTIPDFAFPQTVIEKSDSILHRALKSGDSELALRAAMNLCVARNLLIDSESVKWNSLMMDSVAQKLSGDFRSIAKLIEAEMLKEEYESNLVVYENRNLPMERPFPEDPTEWSGEMFKTRILELTESATSALSIQQESNLSEISLLITNYESAEKIGLTVSEFIAFKGENLLKGFARDNAVTLIPFYPQEEDHTIEGRCKEKAYSLINMVINTLSGTNSLVKGEAMAELSRLLPDNEKENYLREALTTLKGTEGKSIILYELWNRYGDDFTEIYNDVKTQLENYPSGYFSQQLAYVLSRMQTEKIEVEFPRKALPGQNIKGTATISNIDNGYLLVYKVEQWQSDNYDGIILKKFNGSGSPKYVINLSESRDVPFSINKEVEIPGLPAGLYVVIPSKSKRLTRGWNKATSNANYSTIRVSDISILTSFNTNEKESGRVYVVKGKNQEPVAGATVRYFSGDSKTAKGTLTTNKEGWVKMPSGYYRIEATYGSSMARNEAGFSYYPENKMSTRHASILTDLSVYRPGDTVKFAVMGWIQDKSANALIRNTKIEVGMRDVNYTTVGTVTLELNEEGRANGEIVVPTGRLLGNYTLMASYPEFPGVSSGMTQILVEEYKLPGFMVTIEQTETAQPDEVSFTGIAMTYAGMPVTEGNVNLKVEYLPWRWGWGPAPQNATFTTTTRTNQEGKFELTLPTGNLRGTIFDKGRYTLTAEVTSPSGETQKSRALYFYLGKGDNILPSIPDRIEVKGETVEFNVPVYDIAGLPEKINVKYVITNLNDTTSKLKGEFLSPILSMASQNLQSGRYKLEFRIDEDSEWTETETVLWRDSDTRPPYPTPLWIPQNEYAYKEGEKSISVKFGGYSDEWLLYVLSDGEKTLKENCISPHDSLINLTVEIPAESPTLFITLSGMENLMGETGRIQIMPARNLEKMEVRATSFRDKISAGDKEEWSFQFSVGEEGCHTGEVNAFAVMTDKALNAIRDFKWGLSIWKPGIYSKVSLTPSRMGTGITYKNFSLIPKYPSIQTIIPGWETYGYPLVSFGMRLQSPVVYRAMAMKNAMADLASDDAIVTESAQETTMETGATGASDKPEEVELRPVEIPVAFFMPDLKTNEKGGLTLKFEVPNFNTTWQLQLAGYNEELMNTSLIMDAVASKPVMVKSNLPQYLRTGDKASISATIYNNSEGIEPVGGKIEILNPNTGEIICSELYPEEDLKPSGNRTITIQCEVGDDLTSIVVRTYAIGKNHSDGEQGLVPILPSSTPVTEAITFYGKTNQETIEVKVPKLQKNSNVTLKYCDNPLWEVLLAIPGMREDNNGSSLSTAKWLYGTLLANDIINRDFEIAVGLQRILESDDTTISTGSLQKDQTLKIAALDATPWVNDAKSETARIRSLGQYLDSQEVESQMEIKWTTLKNLQQADGGWSWFEGFKSSPYITSQIIEILGYLNERGLLIEEAKQMAKNGVRYYDAWLEERMEKNKGFDVQTTMDYLYARRLLDLSMNKTMQKIEKECLDSITVRWRHWNPGQKAKGALLLMANKEYKDEATKITASLKEFIGKRTPIDQEALMLELFEKTEPGSDAAERVRENLFLQKETENWGENSMNAGIIHILEATTPNETYNRELPDIYVGDENLTLSQTQALTGNFTINLDPKKTAGKKIVIKRQGGLPAWGGVISQYVAPIKDVKKEKVENLAVEKHVYVEESDGKVKEVNTFKKGDKVTVVMNISSGKDMDYVVISDSRAACLQPEDKTSGITFIDGQLAYREIRRDKTSFFIERLPAGKYVISYECYAEREGEYSLGITEVQSLYSPSQVAHSGGKMIGVR